MAYPSVQAMKDALGDIILLEARNPQTGEYLMFRFEDLPTDGQLAVFQFFARIPNA